jgi:hypothetical protein
MHWHKSMRHGRRFPSERVLCNLQNLFAATRDDIELLTLKRWLLTCKATFVALYRMGNEDNIFVSKNINCRIGFAVPKDKVRFFVGPECSFTFTIEQTRQFVSLIEEACGTYELQSATIGSAKCTIDGRKHDGQADVVRVSIREYLTWAVEYADRGNLLNAVTAVSRRIGFYPEEDDEAPPANSRVTADETIMDRTTEPASSDKDMFVFWPLPLAVGLLFVAVFFGSYPEYGDHALAAKNGTILSIIVLFLSSLFCFLAAAYAASARMWRLAASLAVFPAVIVIAVLYQDLVLTTIGTVITYIYRLAGFETDYPY